LPPWLTQSFSVLNSAPRIEGLAAGAPLGVDGDEAPLPVVPEPVPVVGLPVPVVEPPVPVPVPVPAGPVGPLELPPEVPLPEVPLPAAPPALEPEPDPLPPPACAAASAGARLMAATINARKSFFMRSSSRFAREEAAQESDRRA
jgi:hypothetical protein